MMLKRVIWAMSGAMLAWVVAVGSASGASRLTVCEQGCQYATIVSALAAASDGDTIAVRPGDYDGGFVVDKNVTLVGAGSAKTQITGGAPVVTVAEGTVVSIRRVTITGGSGILDGGILNQGTLSLIATAVKENSASGDPNTGEDGAGGLYNSGAATVRRSVIRGNDGVGIFNSGPPKPLGSLTLVGSTVAANSRSGIISEGFYDAHGGTLTITRSTVVGNGGWGVSSGGDATVVVKSTISRNADGGMSSGNPARVAHTRITENGGLAGFADGSRNTRATISASFIADNSGVGVYSGGNTEVTRTRISGNGNGGAHIGNNVSSLLLSGSSVTGNTADYGGGIFVEGFGGGGATIVNSTVSGNTARFQGGGIFLQEFGALIGMKNSTVEKNQAASGGGVFVGVDSYATIATSTISANVATGGPGSGGGIFNDGGNLTLDGTVLEGNIPEDCVGCG